VFRAPVPILMSLRFIQAETPDLDGVLSAAHCGGFRIAQQKRAGYRYCVLQGTAQYLLMG
jgi:hypothetical protein